MKEVWKDIEGYEGKYQVSNFGNVMSLNYNHTGKKRLMKLRKNRYGYLEVHLYKDGKVKWYKVHRLVAQAFLANPNNLSQVNHKDQNKENNIVSNLEFCSPEYNVNYGDRNERASEKQCKPIFGVDKVSGLIVEYKSAKEAGKVLGINPANITACCKGKRKSAGNFYWFYADTKDQEHQENKN